MANLETNTPEDQPIRAQLLNKAASLITGQREKDYGTPEENFARIAGHWTIHLKKILLPGTEITPRLVAEMMMLLKVARAANSPTEDSYLDAAGYAGIAGELADTERQVQIDTQLMPEKESTENIEQSHNCGPWCR